MFTGARSMKSPTEKKVIQFEIANLESCGGALGLAARLLQNRFLRFLIAGGVNTAFGYALFLILLRLSGSAFFALTFGTILGVLFNFMTTGSFVFRAMERHRLWRFFAVYGLVYIYNAIGLALLQARGISPALAGLVLLPGAVALSYLLNRSFVFRERAHSLDAAAERTAS
jgi:putative flippase GtrA